MTAFVLDETFCLTDEQRKRIAGCLGTLPPEKVAIAIDRIQYETRVFVSWSVAQEGAPRPGAGNAAIKKVMELAESLSEAIKALPDDAQARLTMHFNVQQLRVQRGNAVRSYTEIHKLNDLLMQLVLGADESLVRRGKPPDRALRSYVWKLAEIFREATGSLPTRSYSPRRRSGEEEGGVARAFFGACLDAAGYTANPDGIIKSALKALQDMDINHKVLPTRRN